MSGQGPHVVSEVASALAYSSFKYKRVLISCPRYDLQIRYLPEDFMESLKEDKTTLLYFYQQVKDNSCAQGPV